MYASATFNRHVDTSTTAAERERKRSNGDDNGHHHHQHLPLKPSLLSNPISKMPIAYTAEVRTAATSGGDLISASFEVVDLDNRRPTATVIQPQDQGVSAIRQRLSVLLAALDCFWGLLATFQDDELQASDMSPTTKGFIVALILVTNVCFAVSMISNKLGAYTFTLCLCVFNIVTLLVNGSNSLLLSRFSLVVVEALVLVRYRGLSQCTYFSL